MNLSIPPNSISSITQRASPLHQPMKLFISSNGFQKISTVIQNILIKSISHSVNFTIPDLKPRTHTQCARARTHWIYTRPFRLESVISSNRFESFQRRKWRNASRKWATLETCTHQRIRTWNLMTAIEPRPRTPTRSMITAIIVVTTVEIFIKRAHQFVPIRIIPRI